MKKILLLFIAAAMMFYMTGCIKTSDLVPTLPNDPNDPDPTEIGTPVGDAVSKSIGKDGGSIASADGNAELIFPAGALVIPWPGHLNSWRTENLVPALIF